MSRVKARKESYRATSQSTAIISITDVESRPNSFNCSDWLISVLRLNFDDVEKGEKNCITEHDARRIKAFVDNVRYRVDRLIVHCEAGVSRSAGVAAAIMKGINGDDMPIFENGRFCPNMTCYRAVLNAFMDVIEEDEINDKERLNIERWKGKHEDI